MKSSDIKLIWDRVLIKPQSAEEKTKGGIIIPEDSRQRPEIGTVVACGSGRMNEKTGKKNPMNAKVGMKVMFQKEQFETLKLDDGEFFILNDFELLAIVE